MKKIMIIFVVMMGCVLNGFSQKKPVFNNGFQYELEAGTFGGSMALSYKFAKRFSFGGGYWYGVYYWDSDNINEFVGDSYIQKITTNYHYFKDGAKDKVETSTTQQGRPNSRLTNKMFLTGQIRPMNKAFSFLFGANVGYETIQLDDYWYPYYGDKQQTFFVTPYTGFSFRMKNFYINLKGGLNMVDKIKPENNIATEEASINYPSYNVGKKTTTIEYPDIDISSLYAVMNFTWTLNFGHGYREKQRIAQYRNDHPKVKKQHDGHVLNTIAAIFEGASNGLNNFTSSYYGYPSTYTSPTYTTPTYTTPTYTTPSYTNSNNSGYNNSYTNSNTMSDDAAFAKGNELFEAGNYSEAARYYSQSANKGDRAALYNVALCFYNLEQYSSAFEVFQNAANKGLAKAQFMLGLLYQDGKGVQQNDSQAFDWIQKAANQGYLPARTQVAYYYLNGEVVSKNEAHAVKLFQEAANQGDARAQYMIGSFYHFGNYGFPKDKNKAIEWFQKSADQDFILAKSFLKIILNE